jgi:C-terminal processing protease CtpA/Prc
MNPTDEFKAAGEAEVEPDFLETVMRRVREAEVRRRNGRRAVALLAVTLMAGLAVHRREARVERTPPAKEVAGAVAPGGAFTIGATFGAGGSETAGVAVVSVRAGSPAWRAGLRAGDWIVTIDGVPVRDVLALQRLANHGGRSETVIEVVRARAHMLLTVSRAPLKAAA